MYITYLLFALHIQCGRARRGCDHMVVGFPTTCTISAYHTKVVSLNTAHGEVLSIQHYVIKFVSDFGYCGYLHQ